MKQLVLAVVVAIASIAATAAAAESWEYKSYKKSRGSGTDNYTNARISIEENAGQYEFQIVGGTADPCMRGTLPAVVTKTEATTTIEPQMAMTGCERLRYVIRNDGSGGDRENWREDRWVKSRTDHGLTPVK